MINIPNVNFYDRKDMVKREGYLMAGSLKIASYRVRDPETFEWSPLQIHMTYDNTVLAVLDEESAKLLVTFMKPPIAPTE